MCRNKIGRSKDEHEGEAKGEGEDRVTLEVVAHRGANREAPENTLPAFQRALDLGVHGIELDVQYASDGVPVVHHDPSLHAPLEPGGPVSISSLTSAALRERNVPTLDQVIALVDGRCRLYVEVKAAAAVEAVVERLRSRTSWCAIHSFDHRIAAFARALEPRLTCGILLVSYLVDIEGAMGAAGATDVWQQHQYIDRDLVHRVHGAGGRVLAWTVNEIPRARDLAMIGADAVCTDAPREFMAGLNSSRVDAG